MPVKYLNIVLVVSLFIFDGAGCIPQESKINPHKIEIKFVKTDQHSFNDEVYIKFHKTNGDTSFKKLRIGKFELVVLSPSSTLALVYSYKEDTIGNVMGTIKIYNTNGEIITEITKNNIGGCPFLSDDGRFVVFKSIKGSRYIVYETKLFFYNNKGDLIKTSALTFGDRGFGTFSKDGHFVLFASTNICRETCSAVFVVYDNNSEESGRYEFNDYLEKPWAAPVIDEGKKLIILHSSNQRRNVDKCSLLFNFKVQLLQIKKGWVTPDPSR
jgi:hypothetical protein